MASPLESDPLLHSATASTAHPRATTHCSSLKRNYRTTCVTTKVSLVILLWSAVIHTFGFAPVIYFITIPVVFQDITLTLPFLIYYMLGLLMYPLAGFIGDTCFTRFQLLTTGSLMVLIGGASFGPILGIVIFHDNETSYRYVLFLPLLLIVPGIGLFQANVLQYGTDQLDFASSEVISSFVYWYYWTCYVFFAFGSLIMYMVPWSVYSLFISLVVLPVIVGFAVLIITPACAIGCCCYNRSLRAHPGRRVNPVKLIWRVMQFVKNNKHPLRRSAFTYNERPSRLDLAKQRYGGPFTTEEVEDVKSFWWILLLIASLVGFQFFQDGTIYMNVMLLSYDDITFEDYFYFSLTSSWTISALVVVMAVPIYQFIVRPCFPARILKMVTKMFLGLLLVLVSLTLTTAFSGVLLFTTSVYRNQTTCNSTDYCDPNTTQTHNISLCSLDPFGPDELMLPPDEYMYYSYFVESSMSLVSFFYLLAIPQALNGLSHMLVFLTVLEFILAQAPRTFQGFLIGLWYAMQSVGVGVTLIGYKLCAVYYYAAKTGLVLLSLILFVFTALKYKYRQLNEDADVNVHQQIEVIFERNFDREAEYDEELQREEQQHAYHIVDDNTNV